MTYGEDKRTDRLELLCCSANMNRIQIIFSNHRNRPSQKNEQGRAGHFRARGRYVHRSFCETIRCLWSRKCRSILSLADYRSTYKITKCFKRRGAALPLTDRGAAGRSAIGGSGRKARRPLSALLARGSRAAARSAARSGQTVRILVRDRDPGPRARLSGGTGYCRWY